MRNSITFEGHPVTFIPGDSMLVALLRSGLHPAGGGCLCLAGDCPHCMATVDGISYVRTCQIVAKPGMIVERHPVGGHPPLPVIDTIGSGVVARNSHCDVVVIGSGESGRAAEREARQKGNRVIAVDAAAGQEVIGRIFPPPFLSK